MTTTLFYDVMKDGRFVCTMRYRYLPCFGIDYSDLLDKLFERRPSLRGGRFTIMADEFQFTVEPMKGRGNEKA